MSYSYGCSRLQKSVTLLVLLIKVLDKKNTSNAVVQEKSYDLVSIAIEE